MSTLYKRLAMILTLLLTCSGLSAVAFAQTFSDIQGNWAQTQIEKWESKGLVKGYPDGTFKPDNPVTRAEFVTMVNHAFIPDKTEATSSFTDVKNKLLWYYHEVAIAKQQKYIAGYPDGTFKPENYITNQEVAQILSRLFVMNPKNLKDVTYIDKNQIEGWASDAVKEVTAYHIMNGYTDGTFKPKHDITRAETLVALDNAFLLMNSAQPTDSNTSNPIPLPLPLPIQLPVPIQLPDPSQLQLPPILQDPGQVPIQLPIPPVQLPGPVPPLPLPLGTDTGILNLGGAVQDTVNNTTDTLGNILNTTTSSITSPATSNNTTSTSTSLLNNTTNTVTQTVTNVTQAVPVSTLNATSLFGSTTTTNGELLTP